MRMPLFATISLLVFAQTAVFAQATAELPEAAPGSLSAPISNVAGNGSMGYTGDGKAATGAQLNQPGGIAFDKSGNLFIADTGNNVIRRVDAVTHVITTVAGGVNCATAAGLNSIYSFYATYCGDGEAATKAGLDKPTGLVVDATGDIYIADTGNDAVRRVDGKTGIITSFAGAPLCGPLLGISTEPTVCVGQPGYAGDGAAATKAELNSPSGVALDSAGELLIADTQSHAVRKVSKAGIISTLAGAGSGCASQKNSFGDGCPPADAILSAPTSLSFDTKGDLYIAEGLNDPNELINIREVNAKTGLITTVAGQATTLEAPGCAGETDGGGDGCPATDAGFDAIFLGAALDANGNLYIADQAYEVIHRLDIATGYIYLAAGGFEKIGNGGGTAESAEFDYPQAVAVDSIGNLYIADTRNNLIRKITYSTSSIGASVTTLVSDGDPQKKGVKVTFTAHVTPASGTGKPTGTVSFTINGGAATKVTLDSTGHASYATSTLAAGTYKVVAAYSGDKNDTASNATLTETIYGPAAKVAIASGSAQTAVYGSEFAKPLVAIVKDSGGRAVPGTLVKFTATGMKLSSTSAVTDLNGHATIKATATAVGALTAKATVTGIAVGATFAESGSKAALTVKATSISVPEGDAIPKLTYTITGYVDGDTSKVVSGAPVETTTAVKGSPVGSYPITIKVGTLAATKYTFRLDGGTLKITASTAAAMPAATKTSAIPIAEATSGATVE
jgi:hypothetical protein